MNEFEKLAMIIAEAAVACMDSRMARAFDRLMATEGADTSAFAIEEGYESFTSSAVLANSARA